MSSTSASSTSKSSTTKKAPFPKWFLDKREARENKNVAGTDVLSIKTLLIRTSDFSLRFLPLYEVILFQNVSKFCLSIVADAPHLFQKVEITDLNLKVAISPHWARRSPGSVKHALPFYTSLFDDNALLRLFKLCGDQLRVIVLKNLPNISANGFAMLQGHPQLKELHIIGCPINVPQLLEEFFCVVHPKLRTIRLAGCIGTTEQDLEKLHSMGINDFDVFECQACLQISDVQSQCKMKGCQPSTLALCQSCAEDQDWLQSCAEEDGLVAVSTKTCIGTHPYGCGIWSNKFNGRVYDENENTECEKISAGCSSCTDNYKGWLTCEDCDKSLCVYTAESWGSEALMRTCDECDIAYCKDCVKVKQCASDDHLVCEYCSYMVDCGSCGSSSCLSEKCIENWWQCYGCKHNSCNTATEYSPVGCDNYDNIRYCKVCKEHACNDCHDKAECGNTWDAMQESIYLFYEPEDEEEELSYEARRCKAFF